MGTSRSISGYGPGAVDDGRALDGASDVEPDILLSGTFERNISDLYSPL